MGGGEGGGSKQIMLLMTIDTHQNEDVRLSSILAADSKPAKPADHSVREKCHRVANVVEGADELDRAHSPVTA